MYGIVVAILLAGAREPKLPVLVESYGTLDKCRASLIEVSKLPDFKRVVSPLFGYSVIKEIEGSTTMAFCVKNIVSI
jgi:hypothetical protein